MSRQDSTGEESVEWQVDKIVDSRQRRGKTEYLVSWVAWDKPTWEPEENLLHCEAALSDFFKSMGQEGVKGKRKKEAETSPKKRKASVPEETPKKRRKKEPETPIKAGRSSQSETKTAKSKRASVGKSSKDKVVTAEKKRATRPRVKKEMKTEGFPGSNRKCRESMTVERGRKDLIKKRDWKRFAWKGMSASDATWEPAKHLHSCQRLIEEFECTFTDEKVVDYFVLGLECREKPSLANMRRQFLEQGICHLKQGIRREYLPSVKSEILAKFDQIMHTIRARDMQKELERFTEFKTRVYGRYDMQIHLENFPILCGNPPWMPLVRAILGKDCVLKYTGCIIALPGALTQPYHSDGEHLAKTYLPPHAINVFVPLVDLTRTNGATQYVPESHIDFATPVPPLIIAAKAGECILFDYRLKHRGLGNLSQTIRPLIYFTYAQPHFIRDCNFSQRRYKKLPPLLAYNSDSKAERSQRMAHREAARAEARANSL